MDGMTMRTLIPDTVWLVFLGMEIVLVVVLFLLYIFGSPNGK